MNDRVEGNGGWAGRIIDQDHEGSWRRVLRYTAKLEVPFCAMLAWVPNRNWTEPSGLHTDIPNSEIEESGLIQMEHQAAGHSCLQILIEGFPFELSSWGEARARSLVIQYWNRLSGLFEQHGLERVESFRRQMLPLTTVCLEQKRVPLCESFYAFDYTDENLQRVAADPGALKREVAALGSWVDPSKAVLCFVAENSD